MSRPVIRIMSWGALITGVFLALGAASMLALAGLINLIGLSAVVSQKTNEPLSILLLSGGIFSIGILLLPGVYFNFLVFFNKPNTCKKGLTLDDRILIPSLIFSWIFSLALGQLSTLNYIFSAITLPWINLFAIGLPILLYIRISLRGMELPTAQRMWSIFGASLIISPSLSIIFEIIAVVVIILLYTLYLRFLPGQQVFLNTLIRTFQSSNQGIEESMRLVADLFFAPGIAITALATFSLAIPLIEETLKVILIWPIINRIHCPSEGFALGSLCGAAFALTENFGFSSSGSNDWVANVAIRATVALPHIFNSGLMGWAIVSSWKNHHYGKFALAFASIFLLHGTWNAISLGIAVNNFAPYSVNIPFYLQNMYPWIVAWIFLTIGLFGGLVFNNSRMRSSRLCSGAEPKLALVVPEPIEKLRYNSRLPSQNLGENNNGNPNDPD